MALYSVFLPLCSVSYLLLSNDGEKNLKKLCSYFGCCVVQQKGKQFRSADLYGSPHQLLPWLIFFVSKRKLIIGCAAQAALTYKSFKSASRFATQLQPSSSFLAVCDLISVTPVVFDACSDLPADFLSPVSNISMSLSNKYTYKIYIYKLYYI